MFKFSLGIVLRNKHITAAMAHHGIKLMKLHRQASRKASCTRDRMDGSRARILWTLSRELKEAICSGVKLPEEARSLTWFLT